MASQEMPCECEQDAKRRKTDNVEVLHVPDSHSQPQESQPAADEPVAEARRPRPQLNAHGQSQQFAAEGDSGWFSEDDRPTQRFCPDGPDSPGTPPPASQDAAPAIMSAPAGTPLPATEVTEPSERQNTALRQWRDGIICLSTLLQRRVSKLILTSVHRLRDNHGSANDPERAQTYGCLGANFEDASELVERMQQMSMYLNDNEYGKLEEMVTEAKREAFHNYGS